MAARLSEERRGSASGVSDGWADDERAGEIERYRAWIAAKLLQGLGIVVLLMVAVILFDSW